MVAQAACVIGRRDEAAAERVHFRQRADHASIAEVIGEHAACEARAGGGFDGDEAVILFAAQLFPHEWGNQAAEVRAAAGPADDNVGRNTVFIKRDFRFQTNDRLMEQDLIQDAAEHIAVAGGGRSHLDSFTDGAAEGAGRVGVLCENGAADVRGVRRAGRDACAIGAHDLAAEGLLLIRALDHEDLQVKAQIRASHGKGCAPLPGARLGRNALEALLLGIVRLRDSGVQFVTAGCIVALKFVIDFRRGAEFFFQTVCAHQRRRTVHLVKVTNFLRNGNIRRVIVQFLLDQFVAEDRAQIVKAHGLAGAGVHERRGFIFHVCANIIPILGHLRLRQIDLVRNVFGFHGCFSFRILVSLRKKVTKKTFIHRENRLSV